MAGTLDIGNRLSSWLKSEECSVDFFAALLDGAISPSRLRLGISGQKDFEHGHREPIETLLSQLKEIAAEHAPLKLRWSDPKLFTAILESRRRTGDGLPTFYSVKISDVSGYFVRRERGGSVIRTPKLLEAAGMPNAVAAQIVEALQKLGHFPTLQINPLVSQFSCVEDFGDLWK